MVEKKPIKRMTEEEYLSMQRVRLREILEVARDTFTLKFEKPKDVEWSPGSNTHLAIEGFVDDELIVDTNRMRHFSIMSHPSEDYLGITTRIRRQHSDMKDFMVSLKPGDKMITYGVNNRMPLKRENKPIILISMGVGVTTMRSLMLDYAKDQSGIPKMVFLNVDSSEEYIFMHEINQIYAKDFESYYFNSREEFYAKVKALAVEDGYYYIVGSLAFLKQVIESLMREGVTRDSILMDKKEKKINEIFDSIVLD